MQKKYLSEVKSIYPNIYRMKKTLLIIDVQEFFINAFTEPVVAKIASYITSHDYDEIVFSVFQNIPTSNFVASLHRDKCMWEKDIELHQLLHERSTPENTFFKSTYSLFKQADFLQYIDKNQLAHFDICGIDTNACIIATAFDWFDLGYYVHVLPELCASHSGNLYHDASIQIIDKCINTTMISS